MRLKDLRPWYLDHFKESLPWRKVGREAEIPLVNNDGSAGDARRLWPHLAKLGLQPDFDNINTDVCIGFRDPSGSFITTDAGICTLEVCSRPCDTLWDLNDECNRIFEIIAGAAAKEGMQILGYGVQPLTSGHRGLWMPKGRYETGIIPILGEPVHRVTVTASDQCHIDITKSEIVDVVNVLNGLSGAIIALMANSPVEGGAPNSLKAPRELTWDGFVGFENRIGLTAKTFSNFNEWLEYVLDHQFIFRYSPNDNCYELRRETFREFASRDGFSEKDFLMHEGCLWWSARPRTAYGTVEVRPACQQPPKDHMVLQALTLGLVSNLQGAKTLVSGIGWGSLREFRLNAIRDGICARLMGKPAALFLGRVVQCAMVGLELRGEHEEGFLYPVIERVERSRGPADRAISIFRMGGIPLLVEKFAYNF